MPSTSSRFRTVALVGNPNAGKTSVFNAITGLRQKVGNYPGVTVELAEGRLRAADEPVRVLDVPGLYSLTPTSEDERIAAESLHGEGRPDLILYVLDAHNLERNLFLYSQVAELGTPVVVALTMVDRVEGRLDVGRLSALLGVPVVPVEAHRGRGSGALIEAIQIALREEKTPEFAPLANAAIQDLRARLARIGSSFEDSDVKAALSDAQHPIARLSEEFPEIREAFELARTQSGSSPEGRYAWAARVAKEAIAEAPKARARPSDRIDRVLTDRVFGLAAFVGIMYLVFQSIYTFAAPLMELVEHAFGWIGDRVGGLLEGNETVRSLVVDGLIGGVGGALVFLPQILILFFFISVLEGSGYLARAAFLMDRLLGWCGLNGRAFIPLLSSFACAIPGVMAARVMPDPKSRLATILVAPLMSCSARLPVYLLLIGAFIQPKYGAFWAGFTLFAMHFLGLFVAIPVVWVLNRRILRGRRLPFVLELPPYQWPRWRDVGLAMWHRGKVFVRTAGTIIVVMSVLVWALSYFPRGEAADAAYAESFRSSPAASALTPEDLEAGTQRHVDQERLENSFLGRFGKAIEPAFAPIGFDWRITTAILSAFPAREVVVPALGIIFSLGGDVDEESADLRQTLQGATWPDGRPLFDGWTAAGLMVFFALCCQCMATLAVVRRETNSWKWPAFMFAYMTTLAYLAAGLVHWIGRLASGI